MSFVLFVFVDARRSFGRASADHRARELL